MVYIDKHYLNNYPDAALVKQAEAIAKADRAGVWGGSHEKPWDYRKRNR
jgi:endonuclease YncB( thermonuclease family)